MKFAMNAPGVSNTATLYTLLKSAGLSYSDVETVNLPFPEHVLALKRSDAATRFMRAYIRAVRFYNGALQNGKLQGPNAEEVMQILSEATPIKSREIYQAITPTGMNPDGRVNKESLAYDLAFYAEQGLINGKVDLHQLIDMSFVESAL